MIDDSEEYNNVTDVIALLPFIILIAIPFTLIISLFHRKEKEILHGKFCEPIKHNWRGVEK